VGNFADGKLRGSHDRTQALEIAVALAPVQFEVPRRLPCVQLHARVLRKTEASRLKDRRNGGADDVLAVLREVGMPGCGKAREPLVLVAVEGNVEHGRRCLGQRDLGDFDFGVRLTVAVELADSLLGFIAEDENFFLPALAENGSRDRRPVERR
jgi:hypothetical protein